MRFFETKHFIHKSIRINTKNIIVFIVEFLKKYMGILIVEMNK